MSMSRRNRSANFSPSENRLFMRLIDKHKEILDNAATDSATNEKKRLAWMHMTTNFNQFSTSGIFRDTEQLRRKLKNMRKLQRRRTIGQQAKIDQTNGDRMDECAELKTDESFDGWMDPLDLRNGDSNGSSNGEAEKANNIQKVTTPMGNDNVLNLLEDFVVNLRKKCGGAGTANCSAGNYAVGGLILFAFFLCCDAFEMTKNYFAEYQLIAFGRRGQSYRSCFEWDGL